MWEFATSARTDEEDARWMRDCVNRDSATRCGREPACKPGDRARVSLAAISRTAAKVRKLRKKAWSPHPCPLPPPAPPPLSPLPRRCCESAVEAKRRERTGGLADGGWRATSARHGRRALRTRVSVRECVMDVIILRNWEPPTDICKLHACESGPLARPVRTAICFWFDTTNCVAGNLLSAAPKVGWLALARA